MGLYLLIVLQFCTVRENFWGRLHFVLLVLSFIPIFLYLSLLLFYAVLASRYFLLRFVFSFPFTAFNSLPLNSFRFAILPLVSSEIHSFLLVFLLPSISSLASKRAVWILCHFLSVHSLAFRVRCIIFSISFSMLLRSVLRCILSVLNFGLSVMSLSLCAAILSWTLPISSWWSLASSAHQVVIFSILYGLLCDVFSLALFDWKSPMWLCEFVYGAKVCQRWLSCCSTIARQTLLHSYSWSLSRVFSLCVQNFHCLHPFWHLGQPWPLLFQIILHCEACSQVFSRMHRFLLL